MADPSSPAARVSDVLATLERTRESDAVEEEETGAGVLQHRMLEPVAESPTNSALEVENGNVDLTMKTPRLQIEEHVFGGSDPRHWTPDQPLETTILWPNMGNRKQLRTKRRIGCLFPCCHPLD